VSPKVTRITLDEPGTQPERRPRTTRLAARMGWLVAPLLMVSVGSAFVLVRMQPQGFLTALLVVLFVLPFVWGLVSVFFPAYADRRCPDCGALAVEALAEDDLHGIRCTSCGYEDREASAWKFAEERDEALEPYVLQERGREAPHRPASEETTA
jgi:Zn ribbon nucleic-acid-binding protein